MSESSVIVPEPVHSVDPFFLDSGYPADSFLVPTAEMLRREEALSNKRLDLIDEEAKLSRQRMAMWAAALATKRAQVTKEPAVVDRASSLALEVIPSNPVETSQAQKRVRAGDGDSQSASASKVARLGMFAHGDKEEHANGDWHPSEAEVTKAALALTDVVAERGPRYTKSAVGKARKLAEVLGSIGDKLGQSGGNMTAEISALVLDVATTLPLHPVYAGILNLVLVPGGKISGKLAGRILGVVIGSALGLGREAIRDLPSDTKRLIKLMPKVIRALNHSRKHAVAAINKMRNGLAHLEAEVKALLQNASKAKEPIVSSAEAEAQLQRYLTGLDAQGVDPVIVDTVGSSLRDLPVNRRGIRA